ncbi:MAG: heat-inducible transcription repressor HrcA [Anaerolineales bacterium]|nr:heat-inducible transcription repressor HrcA [Anaerolineales bacterium]
MEKLSDRQETILGLIIRDYIETAQPVSSKALVERYHLGVSSATVRNEMVALTEKGYLRQPHTSAGREPTEEGYRYFVQRIASENELPVAERRTISHQFYQAGRDSEEWMRLAASVLAHHSRGASLVTAPRQLKARFKHLELISTQGRLALLVLVLQGGEVRQQMLTLAEPPGQEGLSEAAREINARCQRLDSDGVLAQSACLPALGQEVARLIADMMRKAEAFSSGEIFRDGVTTVLAEPEFASSDSARQALRMLEERTYLEEFLAKAISPTVGGVEVVIGGDNSWQELKDCSMVLARYGVAGYATGAMGVLGPQRMAYGRTISTVRFVAGLMSDMMYEVYSE